MSFDNYETRTEYINSQRTCVYCGNQDLVIDDSFDDYGNYQGTRNYCTCEQAKIEQQMKRELEEFENKKKEIENKYKNLLIHNKKAIAKAKLEEELTETVIKYIMYGELHGMKKNEFLEIVGEIFENQVWYDYSE